ncbi:MAG: PrsW family intramembrane metalloprotease [Chloroflexi bacterium]|nr:PrsW family intramembrane metalloprotease [Chloroflexota bacterium]
MRIIGFVVKLIGLIVGLPVVFFLLLLLPFGVLMFSSVFAMATPVAIALALYVFGFCVPAGLWQLANKGRVPSGAFRLPGVFKLAALAFAAVAIGQVVLVMGDGVGPLFVVLALPAAMLPPLAALSLAVQRLGPITTWRRVQAGLIAGSTLSIYLTFFLSAIVSGLVYFLVPPLRDLAARVIASQGIENLFFSPALVLSMVAIAIVAPVVEEFTKPLGAFLLARRLRGPAEAFLVGMAGGVGFAIVENLLYEGAGFRHWAAIAGLRGIGGPLHPLNAGLVAIGWYGVRNDKPGAWPRLFGLYGIAVGLHALWNGAQVILISDIGAYFFGTATWQLDIYGIGQPGVVMIVLVLEAVLLWRILLLVSSRLRDAESPEIEPLVEMRLEQPRRLALLALAAMLLVVPISALYGPLVARYAAIAFPFR